MVIADSGSVHPRLRGELFAGEQDSFSNFGSSPLTRGTHYLLTQHPRRARFIPAYAGNSWFTVPLRMPRGSSPLTRGTRKVGPDELIRLRFIPAYAGNSSLIHSSLMETTVHPRLRGELSGAVVEALIVGGSSPLTRGTPGSNVRPKDVLRFIPAYAGNSQDTHLVRDLPSVHPRLRGELTIRISMVICTSGSSPLTRGTLNDSPYKALTRTVHPRLRGELFIVGVNVKSRVGSSPLTRGTPKRGAPVSGSGRFIPAYAGNSKNCG